MSSALKLQKEKYLRYSLGILLLLVALNALGGGIYGMSGAKGIPSEWLKGTSFHSYFIPSLILFVCVGGSCMVAGLMVLKKNRIAFKASFICSLIIMAWIIVQLIIIGFVSWLQPVIIIVAIIIFILTWLLSSHIY